MRGRELREGELKRPGGIPTTVGKNRGILNSD